MSRLIGAPPGYVGFDPGGLLTEAISKQPHCVLLLDEIEKAHPDVYNILLQVMDHGTLTDNNGRKADFRNVIIIMTTNAGAETLNRASIGFATPSKKGDEMADIKRMFTPEFRNRLDAIIGFTPLSREVILRVVDKFLMQLEDQLHEKRVEVSFSQALRDPCNGLSKTRSVEPWPTSCSSDVWQMVDTLMLISMIRARSSSKSRTTKRPRPSIDPRSIPKPSSLTKRRHNVSGPDRGALQGGV